MDLSGLWSLSLDQSNFGGGRVPRAIDFAIEHHEPSIRFSGTFIDARGRRIPFNLRTVIDGQTRTSKDGTVSAGRVDDQTLVFKCISADRERAEIVVMEGSRDRQVLRVRRGAEWFGQSFAGTEVYQKRPSPAALPVSSSAPDWGLMGADLAAARRASVEMRNFPPGI